MDKEAPLSEFRCDSIALQGIVFETAKAVADLQQPLDLSFTLKINIYYTALAEERYAVTLTLDVTTQQQETVAYKATIHYVGYFTLKHFPKERMDGLLHTLCPHWLYPYACERLNSSVVQGGFPSLPLGPISFEQLYAKQQAQAEQGTVKQEVH